MLYPSFDIQRRGLFYGVFALVRPFGLSKSKSLNKFLTQLLKEKSGIGIIVDYQEITLLRMVCSTFFNSIFFSFNLRNYIFQSAKKCEMTSRYIKSLHVDLNEAAKCVDIISLTLLASLSRIRALEQNTK